MPFIYCLAQFRNRKASNFNILYYITALNIKNHYKLKEYKAYLDMFIVMLMTNVPLRKSGHFEYFDGIELNLVEKSKLYERLFIFCKKKYTEEMEPQIERNSEVISERSICPVSMPIKDKLLNLFEVSQMIKVYSRITYSIKKDVVMELYSNYYFSSIYDCIVVLDKERSDLSLRPLHSLVISSTRESLDTEVDDYLNISLLVACMLVTGFSVIQEAILNVKEIPTFFCEVLTDYKSSFELFNKLKIPIKRKFRFQSTCTAVALLMKVSMVDKVIPLLLDHKQNVQRIWLGYRLLYLQLASHKGKSTELINVLANNTKTLAINFLKIKENSLFSVAMKLTNRIIMLTIGTIAIDILAEQANLLIRSIQPTMDRTNIEIGTSEFIRNFDKFLGCSLSDLGKLEGCALKFKKFQDLIQGIMEIIAVLQDSELIEIDLEQFALGNYIKSTDTFRMELLGGINKAFNALWYSFLLWSTINYNKNVRSDIELALVYARLSYFNTSYLNEAKDRLLRIKYKKINLETQDLINTLTIYLDDTTRKDIIQHISTVLYIYKSRKIKH